MLRKIKAGQKLTGAIAGRTDPLMAFAGLLAVLGTVVVLSGGVWDAVSHISNEPESFWTVQHLVVYLGVAASSAAALVALAVSRAALPRRFSAGVKILAVGAALQAVSGFGDSVSHDVFGIDGLVSLSHQPLELGLVLVSLAGLLILKNLQSRHARRLIPFSIASFIIAAMWLGFNLVLLVGGTLMCLPVYEAFSSGCAIL